MTYRTYEIDGFALPLPIAQAARDTAEAFAQEQPTPEKAEQVRLNTLAVSVVNDYLQMMGIATDLSVSDSWNRIMRLCADVADLEVSGVGRLECRPVKLHREFCPIPPEVWEDRVGYVVVQIDEPFQEASILGFVPTAAVEALPLDQVRSPEDLLDHLYQLKLATAPQTTPQSTPQDTLAQSAARLRVNLSQWFEGMFEAGWQTVDSLLNPSELSPAFAFRGADVAARPESGSGIRRVKLLNMGQASDSSSQTDQALALITEIQAEESPSSPDTPLTNIRLQVHPLNQPTLPEGVQLFVLDESGAVFLEAVSRPMDNYIQLQFSGSSGELFGVEVAFGEVRVAEQFVI